MSSVVVLTPNARRQTVKVTPNTTLLKVLEEACKKHGFNPEDYDITHYNKVMDLTMPIRFSGLPNNAALEMVPVKKRRQEAHVIVALQLEESLERFTESFMPSDSLWTVIEKVCPVEIRNVPNVPVIVYMHREIVGRESLSKTLLKDLGLTSGRAVLRLAFRDSEATPELKAIGSGLYIHPQLPAEGPEPVQTGKEVNRNVRNKTVTTAPDKLESADQLNKDETAVNTDSISLRGETPLAKSSEQTVKEEVQTVKKEGDDKSQCKSSVVNKCGLQQNISSNNDCAQQLATTADGASTTGETKLDKHSCEDMEIENIEYIGERNALVFNPASEGPTTEVNLPDDFFNITVDDVRLLMRDLRRIREDVENRPLSTNATKELNTSSRTLSLLHSYRHTVIRVQFPDRLVLQAIFSPLDTIETVMEFVKQFLEQPDMPFYLYSTPPKRVLEREQRLVEAECVPRAVLYFGISQSSQQQQPQTYLKSSLLSSATTQKQASAAALKVRLDRSESTDKEDTEYECPTLYSSNEKPEQDQNQQESDDSLHNEPPERDQNQQESDDSLHNEPGPSGIQRNANGQTVNKMPKWFKPL